MAVPAEPSLQRPFVGTYAFPIVRAGEAGRQNPFRPVGLALRVEPTLAGAAPSGAAAPPAIPAPPSLPGAGNVAAAAAAKAAAGGIRLLGILG